MKGYRIITFLVFVLVFNFSKAQTASNWKPIWLTSTNMFKGVEGFYQLTTCNGEKVVFMKLVNHNSSAIKAGWKGTVITMDNQFHTTKKSMDSLTVAASSEIAGDCTANTLLVFKLKDFGIDEATFQAFKASDFDFVTIR